MMRKIPLIFLLAMAVGLWQLGCESEQTVAEANFIDTHATNGVKEEKVDFRSFATDLELMSEVASRAQTQTRSDEIAAKQAVGNNVRLLAEVMVMDHKKANDRLIALLDQKNMAITPRTLPTIEPEVRRLTSGGADFDSAYLAMMVMDHKKIISELREMKANMTDPACAEWLEQNIKLNENHLEQAQNGLDEHVSLLVANK